MIFPLILLLSLILLLFGGCWAQIVDSGDEEDGNWLRCKAEKELICHRPSGNDLAKTFEVCVSPKSVPFHLEHGDTTGPCAPKFIPCPESCDETCPMACQDLIGNLPAPTICEDGVNCWDVNGNGACDLSLGEDKNLDGICDLTDCQGVSGSDGINGVDCWDLNANHICDLDTEDTNNDKICSSLDCKPDCSDQNTGNSTCLENVKLCCYIAVEGNVPPSSGFPMLGEIIWPAWNNCLQALGTVETPEFLPCLGQFVHNTDLCPLLLDRYGPGNATDCSLPDFSGMKTAQYAL